MLSFTGSRAPTQLRQPRPAAMAALPAALALLAAHVYVRSLPPSVATPLILLDHLFNLGLAALVLAACASLGIRLLRLLGCDEVEALPRALLALPLGLGAVAYALFALGVLGLFHPAALVAAGTGLIALAAPDLWAWLPRAGHLSREGWERFEGLKGGERLLLLLGCPGFLIALAIALAPPTDYDGLMYHLAVPARFLQAGRLYPMPETIQANFPFTAEMTYSLGLAMGSDVFGRLVNLALWMLLTVGTFWIGRRYLGRQTGFLAALVFITAPGAYLASSTSVELLWALFALAGVATFFLYLEQGGDRWIVLMGIFSGLVLGTKELAGGLPLALGVGLSLYILFRRRTGLPTVFRLLALFSAVALLVASPWYLKNWLWLGSPLYPLFTPADEWARYYLTNAGIPKDALGLLVLPLAIFFPPNDWTFSAGLRSFFFLSYLFLALPAVLLARRNSFAGYLVLFAALFFAVWAAGYQLVRFLFPAFPLCSLLVAHGLAEGRWRGRGLPAHWTRWMLALFLGASVALQVVLLIGVQPLRVVAGLESPDRFLSTSEATWSYPGIRWANDHLPEGSRLFMVGNGQTYYLRQEALPDSTVANMERLFAVAPTPEAAAGELRRRGFTHLFVADGDMGWHLAYRDPDGRLRRQMALLRQMLDSQTTQVYRDKAVTIYRLDSPLGPSTITAP